MAIGKIHLASFNITKHNMSNERQNDISCKTQMFLEDNATHLELQIGPSSFPGLIKRKNTTCLIDELPNYGCQVAGSDDSARKGKKMKLKE